MRALTDLPSPMLWGWGRPHLLWPLGLEAKLQPEGQQAVLVHELAHLRRRDHWTAWLLLIGSCVWWWHPLYWLIRRQLAGQAELACDAWVVATLPQGRRAYAEALLEVALRGSPTAAEVPALGAAGSRRDFARRLVLIMREQPTCRLSSKVLAAAVALAVLTLPAWTLGSLAQPVPPTAAAPAKADVRVSGGAGIRQTVAVPPTAGLPQVSGDTAKRDKKVRDLEEKIRVLLKELHELRGDLAPPTPMIAPPMPPPTILAMPPTTAAGPQGYYQPVTAYRDGMPVTSYQIVTVHPGVENEVTLTRVIYKLPTDKAEALSGFLKEHVKAAVLETKVDSDGITVTTTPDTQRAIGQFVALIRGKSQTKQEHKNLTPR